jgi:hypothetical protein
MDPYPGSFRIVGSDGVITDVLDRFTSRARYTEQVVETFADWVKQTYPSDAPLMWADAYQTDETLSEESIRLWEQHRTEWAELIRPPDSGDFGIFYGGLPPEGAEQSPAGSGEIVADFGEIHFGWVFVYADGRVLWSPDTDDIFEIQLTAEGLGLVRSGALPIETFIGRYAPFPAEAVEDPQIRLFIPSNYAICYWQDGEVDASQVVDLLPASTQPLLRGKERTYTPVGGLTYLHASPPSVECHGVTTDEARQLDALFEAAGIEADSLLGPSFNPAGGDWNGIGIQFTPLLPHGQWVPWGG